MCEVLDRVEEKGRKVGIEEGREEGRIEGKDQARLEDIRNLMKSLKMTVKQAMDAMGISELDQSKYMSRI